MPSLLASDASRWSILGCGLWLAACAGAFSDVEPPEVSLAGLAFDQPGLFEQRLRLDVRLRNPNDFALDVERVLFDLEVNDQQLGKAWTTEGFDVPALGEAVVPVTVIVPTSDLIEQIMEFSMNQRLDYRLKGEAKLNNAAFGAVPFDQDGTFALPKLLRPHGQAPEVAAPCGEERAQAGAPARRQALSQPIESYGLIGNMVSAALVGRDGSIDWLCVPHFDSDACFAALLGARARALADCAAGRDQVDQAALSARQRDPRDHVRDRGRRGRGDRLHAAHRGRGLRRGGPAGARRAWPRADAHGADRALRLRRDRAMGARRQDFGLRAIAGPDALELHTPVELRGEDFTTVAEFSVGAGASVPFVLAIAPRTGRARRPATGTRAWMRRSGSGRNGRSVAPTITSMRRTGARPWCAP